MFHNSFWDYNISTRNKQDKNYTVFEEKKCYILRNENVLSTFVKKVIFKIFIKENNFIKDIKWFTLKNL